jgi:hypothetical protein
MEGKAVISCKDEPITGVGDGIVADEIFFHQFTQPIFKFVL